MSNATRYAPWVVVGLAVFYLLAAAAPPSDPDGQMQVTKFAALPIIDGGRIKPIDTWARIQLMLISNRQEFTDQHDKRSQPAVRWMLDLLALGLNNWYDTIPVPDPEVQDWFGLPPRGRPLYGVDEILNDKLRKDEKKLAELDRMRQIPPDQLKPVEQKIMLVAQTAVKHRKMLDELDKAGKNASENPNKTKLFRIENDQVLALLNLKPREGLRYSVSEIIADKEGFMNFLRQARQANERAELQAKQPNNRTEQKPDLVDVKVLELYRHLGIHQQLAGDLGDVLMVPGATKEKWSTLGDSLRTADLPDAGFELAIVRTGESQKDRTLAAAIPDGMLRAKEVPNKDLPFNIEVKEWIPRSRLHDASSGETNLADQGYGLKHVAEKASDKDEGIPWPACYASVTGKDGTQLGAYLFTVLIPEQTIQVGDAAYTVSLRPRRTNPAAQSLERIVTAYATGDVKQFNAEVADYHDQISPRMPSETRSARLEVWFNNFAPFYQCLCLYVVVFLLACLSWLCWPETLRRSAFFLCLVVVVVHTIALGLRMYIQWRPPVTNLYSSAVFIGWGCVLLCLFIEYLFRNGFGSVGASILGFTTLLIAHHLGGSGDTLEMMQAVLDTNFWLATHVVAVTTGYTATLVAGFFGLIFVLLGVLTPALDGPTRKAFGQIIYGIVCFATLLSFVGTVLGGIWADQSWGRFWGWDPKENGALLIVIMNSMVLHARWGGLVKDRGMAVLAMVGNMVTMWSWFGTNQLGIGLHAYGFNNTLVLVCRYYWLTQLAMIGLGLLPLKYWISFRPTPPLAKTPAPKQGPRPGPRGSQGIVPAS